MQQVNGVHYPDSDFNRGEHYWAPVKPLATGWRRMLSDTKIDVEDPDPTEDEMAAILVQDREAFGSETPTMQERINRRKLFEDDPYDNPDDDLEERRKLWDPWTGELHKLPRAAHIGGYYYEGAPYPDGIYDPDDPIWTHPNVSADAGRMACICTTHPPPSPQTPPASPDCIHSPTRGTFEDLYLQEESERGQPCPYGNPTYDECRAYGLTLQNQDPDNWEWGTDCWQLVGCGSDTNGSPLGRSVSSVVWTPTQ